MTAKTYSTTIVGVDAVGVEVEAQITTSLRRFSIVGLPDGILREARERVRCAIEQSGYSFPHGEIVVSLNPASLPKSGSGFDLAIAISILAADEQISRTKLPHILLFGELGLDGGIRAGRGALATAVFARKNKFRMITSKEASKLALLVGDIPVYACSALDEAAAFLNGSIELPAEKASPAPTDEELSDPDDFGDVIGQFACKRALEIVAAGGHHLLMVGPPGAGKTMLASRVNTILPPLDEEQRIEVLKIHSTTIQGENLTSIENDSRLRKIYVYGRPPFRAPHHSISTAGLVGGGSFPTPGEISLAHRGVLFVDELPEIRKSSLDALRQPLEAGHIVISRARQRIGFPSDFIFIAAMNPCPCGWRGTGHRHCECNDFLVKRYRSRVSGPIMDRFDLQVWVPALPLKELCGNNQANPTAAMQARVMQARERQRKRFGKAGLLNAHMKSTDVKEICKLDSSMEKLLETAASKYHFTARSYMRTLKVARTIADLNGKTNVDAECLCEALSYKTTLPMD